MGYQAMISTVKPPAGVHNKIAYDKLIRLKLDLELALSSLGFDISSYTIVCEQYSSATSIIIKLLKRDKTTVYKLSIPVSYSKCDLQAKKLYDGTTYSVYMARAIRKVLGLNVTVCGKRVDSVTDSINPFP
jgi:hypothetical protein